MERITNPDSGIHRRNGNRYEVTADEVMHYTQEGYLILNDILTQDELTSIDYWFEHFIMGKEKDQMKRDFCDMSQPYGTPMEDFQLVNAVLPGTYRPELKNNIFFQVAKSIAEQLYKDGKADMDYEQFLAKKPSRPGAKFAMHQDLGYWPKTINTWTATFSLALTDSDLINGCLQVVPGSNREPELRSHSPKQFSENEMDEMNRDESHTLVINLRKDDRVVYLPVKRGSVTIHDERIVHGSGGNNSLEWRKTYVMAFRDVNTIREERAMGFTHSHNDSIDWKNIIK